MLSRRNQNYHDDWPSSYKHGDSSYLLDGAESRKWPKLKFNSFKPDPTPSKNIQKRPGASFSKVPIFNGPREAVVVYMQDRSFNSFASNMIKLSVNETKWSILLARTSALFLLFRFGYLISCPKSYRDFGETDPRPQVAFSPLTFNSPSFGEYSFMAPW